jgi:hypothetical protein
MSVSADILDSWRAPRKVLRRHLGRGQSEPFVFSLLVVFLGLVFVALWPSMSRENIINPDIGMTQRLVAAWLGLLASTALWYGLAAISVLIGRVIGLNLTYYQGRLALFAALVGVIPAVLLQGLVAGLIGPSAGLTALSGLVGLAFLYIWFSMLYEAGSQNAS